MSQGKYEKIAIEIGKLVDKKNEAYGAAYHDSRKFLEMLFPNGITVDKYSDLLYVLSVFNKLKRIATRKDAFGENPVEDVAGYSLLEIDITRQKLQERKSSSKIDNESEKASQK